MRTMGISSFPHPRKITDHHAKAMLLPTNEVSHPDTMKDWSQTSGATASQVAPEEAQPRSEAAGTIWSPAGWRQHLRCKHLLAQQAVPLLLASSPSCLFRVM